MPNFISLEELNRKRFEGDPVPITKLQRWCRARVLPARKFAGEWRVDLEEFDKRRDEDIGALCAAVAEKVGQTDDG